MWGAVRGRHTGVQNGTVQGCSGCAGVVRGFAQGWSMQLRKGHGVVPQGRCPRRCWGVAAAQGAQHVAAPGRSVVPSRGVLSGRAGAWHAAANLDGSIRS